MESPSFAGAASISAPPAYPPHERRRRLSPAALTVVNEKTEPRISSPVIAGIVRAIELVLLSVIGCALYVSQIPMSALLDWEFGAATFGLAASVVLVMQAVHLYEISALGNLQKHAWRIAAVWLAVLALATVALLWNEGEHDGTLRWLMSFGVLGAAGLALSRSVTASIVRGWADAGRLQRRTIIVGSDANGEELINLLRAGGGDDLRLLGVFDDRTDDRALTFCAGVPNLGKVGDIAEFARRTRLDLVLFALPVTAEKRILTMLKQLYELPVDIRLAAHATMLRYRPKSYSYLGRVPTIDLGEKPLSDWSQIVKVVFDRTVGACILIGISPLLALIALAIKFDSPGPVFFKQKRFGFNNDRVDVFKFRSLHHADADPLAQKVVTKGDSRVTRVGRFIRRTSLDELPQLINVVFFGNLSLVGPRPHAVQQKLESRLLEETVDGYFARHRVKPGMTGWAQINGWRGEVDTKEKIQQRVAFDISYIENWSIFFDLYIIAKTPFALLKSEGAY